MTDVGVGESYRAYRGRPFKTLKKIIKKQLQENVK